MHKCGCALNDEGAAALVFVCFFSLRTSDYVLVVSFVKYVVSLIAVAGRASHGIGESVVVVALAKVKRTSAVLGHRLFYFIKNWICCQYFAKTMS